MSNDFIAMEEKIVYMKSPIFIFEQSEIMKSRVIWSEIDGRSSTQKTIAQNSTTQMEREGIDHLHVLVLCNQLPSYIVFQSFLGELNFGFFLDSHFCSL